MNRCDRVAKRNERPVIQHQLPNTMAASAKRSATETSGAVVPSWYLIASHVEPQISVEMTNSVEGERNFTMRGF
jgi:hypothetical protein